MPAKSMMLTIRGETMSVIEWAKKTGVRSDTITCRLRAGATPTQAITKGKLPRGLMPDNKKRKEKKAKAKKRAKAKARQVGIKVAEIKAKPTLSSPESKIDTIRMLLRSGLLDHDKLQAIAGLVG